MTGFPFETRRQWAGALLCLAGLLLAIAPTIVDDPGPATDTFSAIERRVRWGALAGLGALLMARTRLDPWPTAVADAVLWVTAGFLGARVIGLALDGTDSARQWMWVAVEAAIVVAARVFTHWYGRRSRARAQAR